MGGALARFNPGASIAYNYNLTRYFGLESGAQVYDFHAARANFHPVPALFWDMRFNIRPRKKASIFCFWMSASIFSPAINKKINYKHSIIE